MKIVQFDDETYGIKKGFWIFVKFRSKNFHDVWWKDSDDVHRYCKFKTIEEARRSLISVKDIKYTEIE